MAVVRGQGVARGAPQPSRPEYQNRRPDRHRGPVTDQYQRGGRCRGVSATAPTSGRLRPHSREGQLRPRPPRGGSRVLEGLMGRADSVQLGVASRLAPLRLLPREGPRLFADRGAGVSVATQPSVTAGEGQPHGQLQRKARAPTPGVGPHLLLINCGGLLPRLVTGPGS